MRVEKAFTLFRQFSARVFRERNTFGLGLLANIYDFITSWRHGRFSASDIDYALTEIFDESTMLDLQYMKLIGARMGFPVVDTITSETCLVTSYNGTGSSHSDEAYTRMLTYRLLRSEEVSSEICIKDA